MCLSMALFDFIGIFRGCSFRPSWKYRHCFSEHVCRVTYQLISRTKRKVVFAHVTSDHWTEIRSAVIQKKAYRPFWLIWPYTLTCYFSHTSCTGQIIIVLQWRTVKSPWKGITASFQPYHLLCKWTHYQSWLVVFSFLVLMPPGTVNSQ